MTTDFMFMRESPVTKNKTQEMAKLIAKAVGFRDDNGNVTIRKSVGAEVVGMTVCPCAQESVRESDKNKLLLLKLLFVKFYLSRAFLVYS